MAQHLLPLGQQLPSGHDHAHLASTRQFLDGGRHPHHRLAGTCHRLHHASPALAPPSGERLLLPPVQGWCLKLRGRRRKRSDSERSGAEPPTTGFAAVVAETPGRGAQQPIDVAGGDRRPTASAQGIPDLGAREAGFRSQQSGDLFRAAHPGGGPGRSGDARARSRQTVSPARCGHPRFRDGCPR